MQIAMVAYADISHDSRVQREAASLAHAGHDVTVFCLPDPGGAAVPAVDGHVRVVPVAVSGSARPGSARPVSGASLLRAAARKAQWVVAYAWNVRLWGRAVTASAGHFDAWHAHDMAGLVALAGSIDRGALLVYDVHDLFAETGTASQLPVLVRRAIRLYERHLVRHVDLAVVVNADLADVVRTRLRPRRLIVVHNCPPRWSVCEPRPDLIRAALGISPGAPIVLYHGVLGQMRGLDRLIEAMLEVELRAAHLVLMGYGQLREQLESTAMDPRFDRRVHVLPAVLPRDLLPWIASADVGALAMPRASLNLYLSTPNKLFECLAAGTPVVVSAFPAVRRIVEDDRLGPLGAVCRPDDTRDLARALGSILSLQPSELAALRRRCARAAEERWNWETEAAKLVDAYAVLARSHVPRPTAAG